MIGTDGRGDRGSRELPRWKAVWTAVGKTVGTAVGTADSVGSGRVGDGVAVAVLSTAILACLCTSIEASAQEPAFRLDTLRIEVTSRIPGGAVGRTRVAEVLSGEELRALPVRSVAEALQWAAGVDLNARSPAQADISIRGSSFEQVLVLVDGVRMSDPQTGHFDLDVTVPLDQVERVEILRGPASAVYGADAVGGVINVVTRDAGDLRGRIEGGSWESARISLSTGGDVGVLDGVIGGEFSRTDGHRDGTDHETFLLHGRGGLGLGGGRLQFTGGLARRDFGANAFYAPFDSYEETRTYTGAVGWSGRVGGVTVAPRVTVRSHDDDFQLVREDPDFFRNIHTSSQTGAELVARGELAEGLSWVAGGEAVRESIESNVLGDRDEDRGGVFAEVVGARGRWVGVAGLRLDGYDNFGATWSPSVSVSFDASTSLRLRGAWGRSFRPPTWTERYYHDLANVGTPDLDPERSWTAELGADLALPGGGVLRATAFRRDSEDLIDWSRPAGFDPDDPPRWETRNVESATFDGLELALDGPEMGGFLLSASASVIDLDFSESDDFVSKSALRPLVRRVTVGVGRRVADDRLLVSLRTLHARRTGETPYTLLDLRLAADLLSGEVYADLTNLTNTGYLDITGRNAPERAIRVGYKLGG